jgi:hypothetical protein
MGAKAFSSTLHTKHVPGRKTDLADSQWLAGLLRHGLLRGSFIPPQQVWQWREMTRLRKAYQESLADFKRLIHKLFECANIKIGKDQRVVPCQVSLPTTIVTSYGCFWPR